MPETARGGLEGPAKPHRDVNGVWYAEGASYEELVGWYKERLPADADWVPEGTPRKWAWCQLQASEEGFIQWTYSRGRRLLVVHVIDIDPPTVQIGVDKNGGCNGGVPVRVNPVDRGAHPTQLAEYGLEALRLGPDAKAATRAITAERVGRSPQIDVAIDPVAAEDGYIARACGSKIARRTLYVSTYDHRFDRGPNKSASLAQHRFYVGRFENGYHLWYLEH